MSVEPWDLPLEIESDPQISPAALDQVRRNHEARAELVAEFGLLTAEEVVAAGGPSPEDVALVVVPTRFGPRYAGYQFDAYGRLRPVITDVLAAFEGRMDGWQVALWFLGSSGGLGGMCPVDLLDGSPEDLAGVVEAARYLAAEIIVLPSD